MLPELPLYGWLIIAVICVISLIMKFFVYRKVFGKKKEQNTDPETDSEV